MTGQRTLEDVGVKRTRQADDAHLDPNDDAARKSQPQPKKAHTESTDAKHNNDSKAKENQGSKSNAGPDSTSANQNKESEPKKPSSEPKAAVSGSKKGDADSDQPAAEAATGEADAKAPLSTSVAKPEGLVEEGRVYFFYRPRVNIDHPTSVADIQRFFMILAPTSRPQAPFRLLIIGKKRLPIADRHERFFGFVEATADKMETLTGQLGQTGSQPATRGYNTTEPARVAGEGVYEIVDRGGRKTSFAYKLEIPQELGEVQQELQIKKEASYTLSMKNPTLDDPPNAGLSKKANYEGAQKKQFGNYRWIPCQDPSLLDAERCEFILIGATEDLQGQMGEGGEHLQKAAADDIDSYLRDVAPDGVDEHDALMAKLRDEINASEAHLPTDPAATGKWQ
ncbi:hypothetical protein ABBQ38_000372 [Trebouxia sp. C0009 RCD-2024]